LIFENWPEFGKDMIKTIVSYY